MSIPVIRLGHRVFDLEAGVHLDEVELAILEEKLQRSRVAVAELLDRGAGDGADLGALVVVERRRARLFQHFLVAALERAIALAEMDHGALVVGEDLHLDMARLVEIFFDIDGVVAERRLGLAPRHGQRRRQGIRGFRDLHAAPAAPPAALINTG